MQELWHNNSVAVITFKQALDASVGQPEDMFPDCRYRGVMN